MSPNPSIAHYLIQYFPLWHLFNSGKLRNRSCRWTFQNKSCCAKACLMVCFIRALWCFRVKPGPSVLPCLYRQAENQSPKSSPIHLGGALQTNCRASTRCAYIQLSWVMLFITLSTLQIYWTDAVIPRDLDMQYRFASGGYEVKQSDVSPFLMKTLWAWLEHWRKKHAEHHFGAWSRKGLCCLWCQTETLHPDGMQHCPPCPLPHFQEDK